MSTLFHIKEHVIEGQHVREYAQATAHSNEEVLKLAVKQYIPKDNPNPKPGDITIIASHANGFVKVKHKSPSHTPLIFKSDTHQMMSYRNSTNHYGMISSMHVARTASTSAASGWPTWPGRGRAAL